VRIVDHHQQRAVVGELGQQRQHRDTDQESVRRTRHVQPERATQRPGLHRRQRIEPIQHRVQQQVQARVGQFGLGLHARAAQHPQPAGVGVCEQRGLADARLAPDDQCAAFTGPYGIHQLVHRRQLGVPPVQHDRHGTCDHRQKY